MSEEEAGELIAISLTREQWADVFEAVDYYASVAPQTKPSAEALLDALAMASKSLASYVINRWKDL